MHFDLFHTAPRIELAENLTANQYEDVMDISFIKKIDYGKIVSKEQKVDTSIPGKKRISFIIENNYGKKRKYEFIIEVIEKDN